MTGFAAGRLEIDLDAIAANWRTLRLHHPSGPVAAVVKADAYGLGAMPVTARLLAEGCRHFFVATMDEAIALRRVAPPVAARASARRMVAASGGFEERASRAIAPPRPGPATELAPDPLRVLLATLNGLPRGAAPAFSAHAITPVLGSLGEVAEWSAHARLLGRRLGAILHVDTGMARLGLPPGEVLTLAAEPGRLDGVDVRYVMTQLASSERAGDPQNETQLARFDAACALLPAAPRSLANSSGIFLADRFRTELARAGAALYGVNPTPGRPNPLLPVVKLEARIQQVREIEPSDTVGYNATWRAARPARIATVGVGYADGWPRALSNRGQACFDGRLVPLVGRVSMDLSSYDVSETPHARTGDWLELIGPNRPAEAVAEAAGTIAYEILTALGRRYDRVYRG